MEGVGETVGVEEEYHLVDPVTGELAPRPALAEAAAAGRFGPVLHNELQTSQLELVTDVCRSLHDVRSALVDGRRVAATAAAENGAALLAAGTHPLAHWSQLQRVPSPRYDTLARRFGALADRQTICGCHVHVGVPDPELAVAVINHARPYLSVLTALAASSPFHEGVDTRFASFRTMWWSAWPTSGAPPFLTSLAHYERLVAELVGSGLIDDATTVYWDVRPSARFPTVEFRVADTCTDVDDAVLQAALARSLVRVFAARVEQGVAAPEISDQTLAAARWRAARYGLRGDLRDPGSGALVPGPLVARRLIAELEPDLREHDEFRVVSELLRQLLTRGTSAHRQRACFARSGQLREVVRATVEETLRGVEPLDPTPVSGALALQPETPPIRPEPPTEGDAAPRSRARRRRPSRAVAHRNHPFRST